MTDERRHDDRGKLHLATIQEQPEAPQIVATAESDDPGEPVDEATLRDRVVDALRTVHDPEIPLNIYDLGLVYGFRIEDGARVELQMTLTAPGCPVAGALVQQVADAVATADGVARANVELVWDPPWTQDRMTDEARLALGLL